MRDAGRRVIVPDLVGFGRSDKPAAPDDYTYQRHVDWMRELIFDLPELEPVRMPVRRPAAAPAAWRAGRRPVGWPAAAAPTARRRSAPGAGDCART